MSLRPNLVIVYPGWYNFSRKEYVIYVYASPDSHESQLHSIPEVNDVNDTSSISNDDDPEFCFQLLFW